MTLALMLALSLMAGCTTNRAADRNTGTNGAVTDNNGAAPNNNGVTDNGVNGGNGTVNNNNGVNNNDGMLGDLVDDVDPNLNPDNYPNNGTENNGAVTENSTTTTENNGTVTQNRTTDRNTAVK